MKSIKITDVGQIKNELNKYKKGKKLDIRQFNQAARLAWLGKLVLMPLDVEDPETKSYLVYVDYPEEFVAHFLDIDDDLGGHIFILDAEQGRYLAEIIEQGVRDRAALYEDLNGRDFYFKKFYRAEDEEPDREEPD
ncbi:MAG: hypothetical protein ACYCQK_07925 [Acidiferrobacteraceae bacterium]